VALIIEGTFSRPGDSTAVVFSGNVPAGFDQDDHGDLVVCGAEASISGSAKAVTLNSNLSIPDGVTLRVPQGWSLTIAAERTLTIESGGALIVDGTVTVNGVLQNNGVVTRHSTGVINGTVNGNGVAVE
jgi:hypothetical protein